MNTLRKNILFKITLLLMLSLKVSVFVYNNYASTEFSVEEISLTDIEDTENEEKEIDEQKKIVEYALNNNSTVVNSTTKLYTSALKSYINWHLEYTTPPPELS